MTHGRVVVIGVGNDLRGDDGAGLAAARLVRAASPAGVEVVESAGDPAAIVEGWDGALLAIVLDAARGGAPPGTLARVDRVPAGRAPGSSHGLGLADAWALGEALGRLPRRLAVLAVVGAAFELGTPVSAPVAAGVREAAREAVTLAAQARLEAASGRPGVPRP